MMKGLGLDESMSNLTSTISGETSISSNARNENQSSSTATNVAATANTNTNTNTMLYTQPSASSFASTHQVQPPPAKKKRGLPGNPDPDAEVIALSPKSLLATNRFICEICNKGFQRDQNLQLHRRGHNLPWKLKQRAKDQVIRKKVYVCPEPSCVHHEPSRALGDLTGIKKHFCRKHGEKKWKCEKCSKKYAVQSDWKAHSKICGTREYRCDCGTLFSRRDSFITHRAFCDALAEESARGINPLINFPSSHQTGVSLNTCSTPLSHLTLPPHLSSHHQLLQSLPLKREPNSDQLFHNNNNNNTTTTNNNNSNNNNNNNNNNIPPWLACPPPPQQNMVDIGGSHHPLDHHQQPSHLYTFNNQYDQNGGVGVVGPTLSSFQAPANPQMSATALLQKAAEMGVTVSTSCGLTGFIGDDQTEQHNQSSMLHDVMLLTSFQSNSVSGGFDSSGFGDFHQAMAATKAAQGNGAGGGSGGGGGNEGLTRDFLGLRTFSHKDFLNMAALGHMTSSSPSFPQQQHDHQNQTPW